MNRLYVVESTPTAHRRRRRSPAARAPPARSRRFARALAAGVGSPVRRRRRRRAGRGACGLDRRARRRPAGQPRTSLVVAGEDQPPVVHALAHAMNERLGNVGKTVAHTEPVEAQPVRSARRRSRELVDDMERRPRSSCCVILGGNPVYTAPADLDFARALDKVPLRVHLGLYDDETARLLPLARPRGALPRELGRRARLRRHGVDHPAADRAALRRRSRARAARGAARRAERSRATTSCATHWQQAARRGRTSSSCWRARAARRRGGRTRRSRRDGRRRRAPSRRSAAPPRRPRPSGLELVFRPDPTVFDGRFANNGWLQELPKPLTKLTWDNAALVAPGDRPQRLGRRRTTTSSS